MNLNWHTFQSQKILFQQITFVTKEGEVNFYFTPVLVVYTLIHINSLQKWNNLLQITLASTGDDCISSAQNPDKQLSFPV